MELTLHKLKEGFVVTSDEQPLRDYKGLMLNRVSLSLTNDMGVSLMEWFLKVIAQQDQLNFSALSEEEQKEIGWFDVEQLARDFYWKRNPDKMMAESSRPDMVIGYVEGFQKAQELLSDRVFTLKDISKAMKYASEITNNKLKYMENYIKSLSQPKSWKIEVEMEKYCSTGRVCDGKGKNCDNAILKPKFTRGKIKILKLL